MTKTSLALAEWTIVPSAAPQPVRHCPSCKQSQTFFSSGRVRLNSNGKRLDAWLIYKCTHCDQTWNRPIFERRPVAEIPLADLEAMQQSLPDWVERQEYDVAGLKALCSHVRSAPNFALVRKIQGALAGDWSEIRLGISSRLLPGPRLDRILSEGWQLSRAQLQRLASTGSLVVEPPLKNALRRPLHRPVTVVVSAADLSSEMRSRLLEGLSG